MNSVPYNIFPKFWSSALNRPVITHSFYLYSGDTGHNGAIEAVELYTPYKYRVILACWVGRMKSPYRGFKCGHFFILLLWMSLGERNTPRVGVRVSEI